MDEPNLDELKQQFSSEDIEWRVQKAGKKGERIWAQVLAYVTNRAVQNRLDAVCGPTGWKNEFEFVPASEKMPGGVMCGLSIRILGPDGRHEWLTKWDGAPPTAYEAFKGGVSDSMKRAAVEWGIGRYLYDLDTAWANIHDEGKHFYKDDSGLMFRWDGPKLPSWALPGTESEEAVQRENNQAAIEMERRIREAYTTKQVSDLNREVIKSFKGESQLKLVNLCTEMLKTIKDIQAVKSKQKAQAIQDESEIFG